MVHLLRPRSPSHTFLQGCGVFFSQQTLKEKARLFWSLGSGFRSAEMSEAAPLTMEAWARGGGGVQLGGRVVADLLGTSLKDHVLLALVQPPLPHGPVMQYPVLPLEEFVQDI